MSPLKDSHLLMVTNTQYKILSVTNTIGYAHLCNINGEAKLLFTISFDNELCRLTARLFRMHMHNYCAHVNLFEVTTFFLDFPNK